MRLKCTLSIFFSLYGSVAIAQVEMYSGQIPLSEINTQYDEHQVVMHSSGNEIYFTRANDPNNVGGEVDKGDIYISSKTPDGWSEPKNLSTLNDEYYNAVAGFSPDGQTMWILNQYGGREAVDFQSGISLSRRLGNSWSKPRNLVIKNFKKYSKHISGSVSPSGKYLLLAMESFGSYGVEDIYISKKTRNGWSLIRNIGYQINTKGQELTPYLAPDDSTLYFSTNGRKGDRSFDVYVTKRLDNTWRNWEAPKRITNTSTKGKDISFGFLSGSDFAFMSSTQDSEGYGDIKIIDIKPAFSEPESTILVDSLEQYVKFEVMEKKSGDPVPNAKILIEVSGQKDTIYTNQNGISTHPYIPYTDYLLTVSKPGFFGSDAIISPQELEIQPHVILPIAKLSVGASISLENVLFEQGNSKMIKGSLSQLDELVRILKENPSIKIELSGHTDSRGDPLMNLKLSQNRVDVVEDYLVLKGIDRTRIKSIGYGGKRPIASNASEETRKLNRRVEFKIIK